jgi:hypothetical protein
MENNPEIAVVGAWIQIMDENGQEVRVRKYLPDDKGLRGKMFRYSPVAHPVVMYKKKVVQEFGCYLPEYSPAEDLNLWFKIGTKYKFANIQEVLLKYRFFEKSSSNKKLREVEIKTLKMHWHAWRYQGYKPSFSDILYNTCQFLTIYLMPIKWRINFFNIIRKYL